MSDGVATTDGLSWSHLTDAQEATTGGTRPANSSCEPRRPEPAGRWSSARDTMEEMTKVPRVENVLTPLLNRAADLSDAALALADSHLPDGMTFATTPQGTIFRLHVAGTATYRSGLVCLRSPETSVGAFSLLRGLLEAWSHVAFIFDPREGGDPRCRALRFERGSMNEWSNSVRVAPPGFDHASWQLSHAEKEQAVRLVRQLRAELVEEAVEDGGVPALLSPDNLVLAVI